MKIALFAAAAAVLTIQPAAADAPPRPDQLSWQCGLVSKTGVSPGANPVTFTVVNRADKWLLAVSQTQGPTVSSAMADAAARAVGSRTIAAVGFTPLRSSSRLDPRGTAHALLLGHEALGCAALKTQARRDYARAYTAPPQAEPARPHPKIVRIKALKHIR